MCDTKELKLTEEDFQALQSMAPLTIQLTAVEAMQIMAALQLALRHPGAQDGTVGNVARSFAKGLQNYVSVTPNLATLCEAGWNPHYDVPVRIGRKVGG